MWRWYRDAKICVAYLVDVHAQPYSAELDGALSRSEWFERGWTLQELLAPANIMFCNSDWDILGTKSSDEDIIGSKLLRYDYSNLTQQVSQITGIAYPYLIDCRCFHHVSIATKMSWAAGRQTSRIEDQAYSLLGLFEISMPLLYGEAEQAFVRLQEEIIRRHSEHSIFVWQSRTNHVPFRRMLASSPADFTLSGGVSEPLAASLWPSAMTNRGLQITFDAQRLHFKDFRLMDAVQEIYRARLNSQAEDQPLFLFLALIGGTWYRLNENWLEEGGIAFRDREFESPAAKEFYVSNSPIR